MKTRVCLRKVASTSLIAAGVIGVTAFSKNPNRPLGDRGTIQNVNTSEQLLTIQESKSKQPQMFTWNQDTRFVERDHLWSKSKPGEPVKIRYHKENDQLVAKTVVISHANKAAASATQSSS